MIMKLKRLLYCLIFFFLLYSNLMAEEKKSTDYFLIMGTELGAVFHQSDFLALPNMTTCCGYDNISFDKAMGLNYSLWLGAEKSHSFWNGGKFILKLSFNHFTGNYDKEAKIGNWIEGDDIKDIVSKQVLTPSLSNLFLTPSISFYVFDKKEYPLLLNLGLGTGFIISGNYEMYEELIEPNEAYFENHQKVRNQRDDNIEETQTFMLNIAAGASYELVNIGDFILSPTISFNYGLTNVVQDVDWKAHSVNLGINLAYHIPENTPKIEEPVIPVLPKLTLPKQDIKLNLETIVYNSENNQIDESLPIEIPVKTTEIIKSEPIIPIVFFNKNSSDIIAGYDSNLLEYIKQNNQKLKVEIGLRFDEKDEIAEARKKAIQKFLTKNSISIRELDFKIIKSKKKERYKEVEAENSFAKFYRKDTKNKFQSVEKEISKYNEIIPQKISVKSKVKSSTQNYNFKLIYEIAKQKFSSPDTNLTIKLDENNLSWKNFLPKKTELKIHSILSETIQKSKKENKLSFSVIPKAISYEKYINSVPQNSFREEYVIGFFDFDEAKFSSIYIDINAINKHLENGGKAEIIAYTDSFGTIDYNDDLGLKRALVAKKLFKHTENISISFEKSVPQKDTTPYSRMKNRKAILRILK